MTEFFEAPTMPDHAHSSDPVVQTQLDRLAALSPGRHILGLEREGFLDVGHAVQRGGMCRARY